jgi:hypothetical protein
MEHGLNGGYGVGGGGALEISEELMSVADAAAAATASTGGAVMMVVAGTAVETAAAAAAAGTTTPAGDAAVLPGGGGQEGGGVWEVVLMKDEVQQHCPALAAMAGCLKQPLVQVAGVMAGMSGRERGELVQQYVEWMEGRSRKY